MDNNKPINKKGRIIVRNLIFDINKHHLQQLFSKYGEVDEITIPINPHNNKQKGFAFIQFRNRNQAAKAIQELNNTKFKGREMVIDFSVDKSRYEEMKKKQQEEKGMEEEKEEEQEEEEEEEEEKEEEEEGDKQKNKQKPKETLNSTLFVRNLPLDIDEEQFQKFFSKFGQVVQAKVIICLMINIAQLVKSKETNEYKGTGFIKMKKAEDSEELLRKFLKLEEIEKATHFKKNYKMSDEHGWGWELLSGEFDMEGRRVFIFKAVDREAIKELGQSKVKKEKTIKDMKKARKLKQLVQFDPSEKRKLKLALRGVFEAREDMPEAEREKRELHVRQKIQKLKNPNSFVSETRVALKNLPKSHQKLEAELKSLIGDRAHKLQLLRDKDIMQVNATSAPYTGLGFIEFKRKDDALQFVSECEHNQDALLKKFKRLPIVEFAIEDARKMKRIEERKKVQREKSKEILDSKGLVQRGKSSSESAKLLIDQYMEKGEVDPQVYEKYLMQIQSRGIRQRLRKKIQLKMGIVIQKQLETKKEKQQAQEAQDKQETRQKKQQSQERKQDKKAKSVLKAQEQDELNDILNVSPGIFIFAKEIRQQVNSKKGEKLKRKRQALEKDEVDEMAEQRVRKLQKQAKWYN